MNNNNIKYKYIDNQTLIKELLKKNRELIDKNRELNNKIEELIDNNNNKIRKFNELGLIGSQIIEFIEFIEFK